MTYELAQLNDGGLVLMSNQDLPDELRRVEYFMGQKLFNLVFNGGGEEMVPYETSDLADQIIRGANGLILVISASNPDHLYGYSVPLVQVGV